MSQVFQIPTQKDRTAVNMAQMATSIAVQRPYFAFDSLYKVSGEWDIWGDFKPEQPLGSELGPLATAEAGRHLAILGSCAAALAQVEGERVYYLASRAHWDLRYNPMRFGQTPLMTARAKIVERSRKRVLARTELLIEGQLYAELSVDYQVLSEKTFQKLFSNHLVPTTSSSVSSPYAEAFPLSVLTLSEQEITAESVGFSAARCEGHFPDYPTWPVAVVMYGLSQVMSRLLDHKVGRVTPFRLLHVRLAADELVSADKQLLFSACFSSVSTDGKLCDVVCNAAYGDRVIATTQAKVAIE
ncbi:hypothetical protein [Pseudomonas sp. Sample_24]|uniref:hypothetical protein n=1 Tax=Pseudomonas sp. Sample_24 TaxID=2448268 RepID=UPI0010329477|nr:hypothetical protein [Pseudomonas sp. Sample_24]